MYTATVRKTDAWWIGWIEEVPGVNSQGKTREELLENLHSALAEAVDFPAAIDSWHDRSNDPSDTK